jgi:hypothetical protein
MLIKYADDTNVLVLEVIDVCLTDKFENHYKWARDNKMIINLSKREEIVFDRSNPPHSLYPDPLAI